MPNNDEYKELLDEVWGDVPMPPIGTEITIKNTSDLPIEILWGHDQKDFNIRVKWPEYKNPTLLKKAILYLRMRLCRFNIHHMKPRISLRRYELGKIKIPYMRCESCHRFDDPETIENQAIWQNSDEIIEFSKDDEIYYED